MRALPLLLLLLSVATLEAQQVPDSSFTFPNPNPAFPVGTGPVVCVDAGHHNFHTLDGRYFTFGKLLRGDGFQTVSVDEPFDGPSLGGCAVLVIANALGAENGLGEEGSEVADDVWDFPHPSALNRGEIAFLLGWIRDGGKLLLIMDHAPMPGAMSGLASMLGVVPLDGAVRYRIFGELPEAVIQEAAEANGMTPEGLLEATGPNGAFRDHPIIRGREGVDEPVRSLMTFGGSAFFPSTKVRPLLEVPPGAVGRVYPREVPRDYWPEYTVDGWLVGGTLEYGEGRVVILGEAATCSAQLAGEARSPMGMNNPLAIDNPKFCLNTVRWLVGVL
jgi:hypothetical protein